MDFVYSEEVEATAYRTDGLDGAIPLRMHKSTDKEIQGAIRAQRDWSERVRPIADYKGGLGDPYSFICVTIPECLPERLEVISYANEFAFLYDGKFCFLFIPETPAKDKKDEMEKLCDEKVCVSPAAL
jgi:hypothetical protein